MASALFVLAAYLLGSISFAVVADVTVDTTGAEGVLFKQGGAHGDQPAR